MRLIYPLRNTASGYDTDAPHLNSSDLDLPSRAIKETVAFWSYEDAGSVYSQVQHGTPGDAPRRRWLQRMSFIG